MFVVTKKIDFCYGHRLIDYSGKCRHLHGHNGHVEIDLARAELDALGLVIDFNDIREVVKTWIDAQLDHRMLLHRSDPLVPVLEGLGEPLYLMDGNPTAENIARLVFEEARRQGLAAVEVRLWETPSACAVYRPASD
jgi:6-pyruvoyltetrahydropterin/6-carboxytetrahydropterin synthase